MTTRMTGLSGLIDTDALVTAAILPYKTKVETQKQKEQTLEWKQEQYRAIMKSADALYTKYLTSDGSSSLIAPSAYNSVKFTSDDDASVSATSTSGASIDNYTVVVNKLASKASTTLSASEITTLKSERDAKYMNIKIGGTDIGLGDLDISSADTETGAKAAVTALNAKLSGKGFTAKYSEFNKGITIEADNMSTSNSLEISFKDSSSAAIATDSSKPDSNAILTDYSAPIKDVAANVTIKNSKGEINTYTGNSNAVTLDNVTFNFKDVTDAAGTKLTGGKDVTALKDKIVSFMKDYNELMGNINTKIYETRDKSYAPLTDDQRTAMTDTQITAWETKAKTGLLRKDSTLQDLAEGMKSAMSGIFGNSLVSSSGLSLEKIGITPVKDYTTQNGLYEVNEDTLKKALEDNFDGIKDMFNKNATSDDTSNSGIIPKLTKVLYDNVKKTDSVFKNLAGDENGVSSLTSDMSKQITEMKKKIVEMEDSLTDREDALYTKYSKLESSLTAMQAQQDSLASYFTSS